jgi:hypothetical protein
MHSQHMVTRQEDLVMTIAGRKRWRTKRAPAVVAVADPGRGARGLLVRRLSLLRELHFADRDVGCRQASRSQPSGTPYVIGTDSTDTSQVFVLPEAADGLVA